MTEPNDLAFYRVFQLWAFGERRLGHQYILYIMKTIKATAVISAQVLNVDFAESQNSYVIHFGSAKDDGSYSVHDPIWTNSTVQPELAVGQAVVLLPLVGKDGKKRYQVLPA